MASTAVQNYVTCSHETKCSCVLVVLKIHTIPFECSCHTPVEAEIVFLEPPASGTPLKKPFNKICLRPGFQLAYTVTTDGECVNGDDDGDSCCNAVPMSTFIGNLRVVPSSEHVPQHANTRVITYQEAFSLRRVWVLSKKFRVLNEILSTLLVVDVPTPLITIIQRYVVVN